MSQNKVHIYYFQAHGEISLGIYIPWHFVNICYGGEEAAKAGWLKLESVILQSVREK